MMQLRIGDLSNVVMAGLFSAIHAKTSRYGSMSALYCHPAPFINGAWKPRPMFTRGVDGRNKRGHDGEESRPPLFLREAAAASLTIISAGHFA
jgi:hypothetical protein